MAVPENLATLRVHDIAREPTGGLGGESPTRLRRWQAEPQGDAS
jgi:hypothetical protein